MLGKLLKYDMKALSRILIPVHLAVLGVIAMGCLAGYAGWVVGWLSDATPYSGSPAAQTVMGLAVMTVVMCVLATCCASAATMVVVLVRFYRNLYTDEGYLTLTLPATAAQQLASKAIAGVLWLAIDLVIVMAGIFWIVASIEGFGLDPHASPSLDSLPLWMLAAMSGDFGGLVENHPTPLMVLGWLGAITVRLAFGMLSSYACLSLGQAVAARHKVAAGIGFLVGFWMVYQFVIGAASVVIGIASAQSFDMGLAIINAFSTVSELLLSVGSWMVCVWVLNRRLNLP